MTAVLDSSAVLVLLWLEPGSEHVEAMLTDAMISAVNLAEVCSKLSDRGVASDGVRQLILDLSLNVVAFDEIQAFRTGELRNLTRRHGLSLGDRACLGLAMAEKGVAITADRTWAGLEVGVAIKTIR